jgi:amidase
LSAFIDAGRALSGMEYQRLLLRRRAFTGLVQRAIEPVDAMLVPAQPFAAPTVACMATLGQVPAELAALIRYTAPFDLSGNPTLTVPAAFTAKGLPVAVQFVGKHLGEAEIFRAGRAFQRVTDWHRRHPRI